MTSAQTRIWDVPEGPVMVIRPPPFSSLVPRPHAHTKPATPLRAWATLLGARTWPRCLETNLDKKSPKSPETNLYTESRQPCLSNKTKQLVSNLSTWYVVIDLSLCPSGSLSLTDLNSGLINLSLSPYLSLETGHGLVIRHDYLCHPSYVVFNVYV